jgi:hypothetical protein
MEKKFHITNGKQDQYKAKEHMVQFWEISVVKTDILLLMRTKETDLNSTSMENVKLKSDQEMLL